MKLLLMAPFAIAAVLMFVALGGQIVKLLWNWLIPAIFAGPTLTFWQALGLLALCRILFGGLGVGGSHGSRMRRRMEDRWDRMTPDERERFRQGMRARWGFGPSAGQSKEI
jgi:hypothetical protein